MVTADDSHTAPAAVKCVSALRSLQLTSACKEKNNQLFTWVIIFFQQFKQINYKLRNH